MSTGLVLLTVGAGLACPAHMLWRMRRGKPAACSSSRHSLGARANEIHAEQQVLGSRIDAMHSLSKP